MGWTRGPEIKAVLSRAALPLAVTTGQGFTIPLMAAASRKVARAPSAGSLRDFGGLVEGPLSCVVLRRRTQMTAHRRGARPGLGGLGRIGRGAWTLCQTHLDPGAVWPQDPDGVARQTCVPGALWDILTLKGYLSPSIRKPNLTGHPAFVFAKYGEPRPRAKLLTSLSLTDVKGVTVTPAPQGRIA